MRGNFSSRVALLSYVERRVIVDIDRFAKSLINTPDIFRPSPYGVYNAQTGECVADFGQSPYYLDRNDREMMIRDWDDFERAESDIFDSNGHVTLSKRRKAQYTFTDDRPIFFKAKEAAAGIYAEQLKEDFAYTQISRNIRPLNDIVYSDVVEESKNRTRMFHRLESVIVHSIADNFQEDEWKKLFFHKRNNAYLVDVGLDHRIEDYHMREFDQLDREREDQEDHYEGRRIHNS